MLRVVLWHLFWRFEPKWKTYYAAPLIETREGTFNLLSFLDQILSAEFLSKNSKLFWREKLTSIGLIWHPDKLIQPPFKKMPLGGAKDEHFSCSHSSCQLGIKISTRYFVKSWVETNSNIPLKRLRPHCVVGNAGLCKLNDVVSFTRRSMVKWYGILE